MRLPRNFLHVSFIASGIFVFGYILRSIGHVSMQGRLADRTALINTVDRTADANSVIDENVKRTAEASIVDNFKRRAGAETIDDKILDGKADPNSADGGPLARAADANSADGTPLKRTASVAVGTGGVSISLERERQNGEYVAPDPSVVQTQTADHWPVFSKNYYPRRIPKSPFNPNFTIKWDFDTTSFLQRPDVKDQPPKVMTWMVKTRYMPPLPEPVRLRVCPEMPCRLTTNREFQSDSAALLWAGQIMKEPEPPVRSHPDQVFVFHNHEPQAEWIYLPSFRKPAWKSAFNWTMHYRFDSDIVDLYGVLVKRDRPVQKNYTDILAKKTKMAAWIVSHCPSPGKREKYVQLLQKYINVDVYGSCGDKKCPRSEDDSCFKMVNDNYKFYLSFENAFCKDYISEKFFRYLDADAVVVGRASNDYKYHAPPGIFINTADFKTTKDLADYLLYLDTHPDDYIKLLKAKDAYQPLYEDWPIRTNKGNVRYMHYHYESVSYCEMCRRLWDLDQYRKTIPDIVHWFDQGNCYPPDDLL